MRDRRGRKLVAKKLGDEFGAVLWAWIEARTDRELWHLARATGKLRDNNCWWVTHRLMPFLTELAKNEQLARKHAKRRAARGGPPLSASQ